LLITKPYTEGSNKLAEAMRIWSYLESLLVRSEEVLPSLSDHDCLICGLDCLIYGLDCLIYGIDCLIFAEAMRIWSYLESLLVRSEEVLPSGQI